MTEESSHETPKEEQPTHKPVEKHVHKPVESAHKHKSTGLGKIFIVVFVAALIGSYAGVSLVGLPLTGEAVKEVEKQEPTEPQPSLGAIEMSGLLDDDAMKGNADAPVTIVEFSDFQCSFCARFYSQTLPEITEKYIDTGKVKLIYRDFPLSFHPQAQSAAEAAECAGEQDKYWEMHDMLYENQESLSTDNYKKWAGEIGLDTEKFNNCLDSGKFTSEVENDFAAGSAAGVSGTPSFVIGPSDGKGELVVGALPFEDFGGEKGFKTIIEEALAAA